MSGVRNLHRLAGTLDRLRREAAAGPCTFCSRSSVGFIESWDVHPKGVCETHAEQGTRLGYTVRRVESEPAGSRACICDGAAYYSAPENASRHPFIVNAGCPVHDSNPAGAEVS